MSIRTRVIVAVTFQKIDCTPDTKTCAQCNHQSLKNANCCVEKCHKYIPPKEILKVHSPRLSEKQWNPPYAAGLPDWETVYTSKASSGFSLRWVDRKRSMLSSFFLS